MVLSCRILTPRTSEVHATGLCARFERRVVADSYESLRLRPRRTSILLIGGDKSGNDPFYEEFVPVADHLYDEHLEELRREGLIE